MTYTVKDIAKKFGLSIHTIRFYDKEGLLPFVSRNKSGIREFTESDVGLFEVICCLKNSGMQLKDIKKYIDYCMEGTGTIGARKEMLLEHKKVILNHMDALKQNLKIIDYKIDMYDSPEAARIVAGQLKKSSDEKRENNLV
jgi:Predicted transcriptional regulators